MKSASAVSMSIVVMTVGFQMPLPAQSRSDRVRLITREVSLPAPKPPEAPRAAAPTEGQPRAYVASGGGRQWVVVDGKKGPAYDGVDSLVISPDGTRVAYRARYNAQSFDRLPERFRLPDRPARAVVVVDGQEGKQYDAIEPRSLCFSPDSRHVVYVAVRGGRQLLVVDGQVRAEYDRLDAPVVSPDGRRRAYHAMRRGKAVVVVDGIEGPEYDGIRGDTLTFSPDSRHVLYVARRGSKELVVTDGQEGPEYDRIQHLTFSPDRQRLAYRAEGSGKWFVVVDGVAAGEYDAVGPLVFSPDSQRLAFVAGRGGKQRVVVDGRQGPEYIRVNAPVFSPDSRRLAYVAGCGSRHRVVVDGAEGRPYGEIQSLCFSPDSRHVAYLVSRNKTRFVLGKQVLGVLATPLAVALAGPYGLQALTTGWSQSSRWRVVVDGVETREYGAPYRPEIVFQSPKQLHVDTMRCRDLHRVEVEIVQEQMLQ